MHAKDARIDDDRLNEVGLLACIRCNTTRRSCRAWATSTGAVLLRAHRHGYDGAVCVEVEDRAYEGAIEKRKAALIQSGRYLRQFVA